MYGRYISPSIYHSLPTTTAVTSVGFSTLSFSRTLSQKPIQLGSPNDIDMFHDKSWKLIYFWVKRSTVKVTTSVSVFGYNRYNCRCCCVRKLRWVFSAVMPRTQASRVRLPLNAGFFMAWVLALLWVPATSSLTNSWRLLRVRIGSIRLCH